MTIKLSSALIGLVVASMFIGFFALFISSANTNYSPSDYNSSKLASFDRIKEINNLSSSIQNETSSITADSGWFDILGAYFSSGYQAFKTSLSSFGLFTDMVQDSATLVDYEDNDGIIVSSIIAIITILIFVGLVLSVLLKVDL